jgi:hypothetical protein
MTTSNVCTILKQAESQAHNLGAENHLWSDAYLLTKICLSFNKTTEWIVDGQQRIVSFCILYRKKPYWLRPEDWNYIVTKNKVKINILTDDFLRNKSTVLDSSFDRMKNSLNKLIQEFRKIGILSVGLIFAKNTIIPIIYLNDKFQNEFEFDKSLHFFLTALAGGRYSGSSESTIQEDIDKINNSGNFAVAIRKLHQGVNLISTDKKEIADMVHYQGEGRFFWSCTLFRTRILPLTGLLI